MKQCIIFCAAGFSGLLAPIGAGDFVIAADGGLAHTEKFQIPVDEILGDFDSLGYIPEDSRIFPVEKDDTDAMLAVRRGLDLGYREFLLYGSLDGPRLDHTIANFQTLQFLCDHGASGYLIGNDYIVTVVKNGSLRFPAGAAGTVSILPGCGCGGRCHPGAALCSGKRHTLCRISSGRQQSFYRRGSGNFREKWQSAGALGSEKRPAGAILNR